MCYHWGAMSEYRLKLIVFVHLSTGSVWHKISGRRVASTNNALYKTRLNDLSYGIKISAYISFILSHFTHLRDRRMDRHLSHSQNVSKLNEVWQNYCRNRMVQYFSCHMEEFISRYCLFRVDNQTVVMIAGISVIRRSTGRVDQQVFSFVCVQLIIRRWSWSGGRVD